MFLVAQHAECPSTSDVVEVQVLVPLHVQDPSPETRHLVRSNDVFAEPAKCCSVLNVLQSVGVAVLSGTLHCFKFVL
jgi:hypothetical protein